MRNYEAAIIDLLVDYKALVDEYKSPTRMSTTLELDRKAWETFHNKANIIAREIADRLTGY